MESLFTSRRTRAVVALVSALLLLSAATVAVTSPLPLGGRKLLIEITAAD
jgi:hypothetical protein